MIAGPSIERGQPPQPRAYILAFELDAPVAARLERDLVARYGLDYEVRVRTSSGAAVALLQELRTQGAEVALVLAGEASDGTMGLELLRDAAVLHPGARLLLLLDWYGSQTLEDPVREALAAGEIDQCIYKPWDPAEIGLHPAVTRLLASWTRGNRPRLEVVRLVGAPRSHRSAELRDLLERNGIPYAFHRADSPSGSRTLADAGLGDWDVPLVALLDGRTLLRPSNAELATALGAPTTARRRSYDVAIVGAGPAGLAAAVAAASEGLRTVVIEREAIGGQAGSTTRIRNYPGFPYGVSGEELARSAFRQASIFGADFVFMQSVEALAEDGGDRVLTLSDGNELRTAAVVVASGVAYRRLGDPTLDALVGAGVYYGTARSEATAMRGRRVVVVGGGNAAAQAALHLAGFADRVTLVTRDEFLGRTMSDYLVREIRSNPVVEVRQGTYVDGGRGDSRLEAVTLCPCGGVAREEVPADALFVLIGAEPHTAWLPDSLARDERGYLVTGTDVSSVAWPLARLPLPFETSVPGVFAGGDVRHGSIPRVVSAAGSGAMAIHSVHAYLEQAPATGARAAA